MTMDDRKTFLGIPIMTQADIDQAVASQEPNVYIVSRVVDTPPGYGSAALRARRLRTLCEGCREVCWLDPKSYDPTGGMKITILCMQCSLLKMAAESPDKDAKKMAEWAIEELRKARPHG